MREYFNWTQEVEDVLYEVFKPIQAEAQAAVAAGRQPTASWRKLFLELALQELQRVLPEHSARLLTISKIESFYERSAGGRTKTKYNWYLPSVPGRPRGPNCVATDLKPLRDVRKTKDDLFDEVVQLRERVDLLVVVVESIHAHLTGRAYGEV